MTEISYHHGDLRQALITAALELLTEDQNWGFSLREVARRAGVSHNAPYNHFHSRQDLLAAVAAAGFDGLRVRMGAVMGAGIPAEVLQAIGTAYVLFGTESPAHYRLMFGTALRTPDGCLPPAVEASAAAAKGLLREVIRQGTEDGSFALTPDALDLAVLSAWSLVHGLTLLLIDGLATEEEGPGPDAEQVAAQVTQMLIDGLRS